MTQFDRTMRGFAFRRQTEFEPVVAKKLVVAAVHDLVELFRRKGELKTEPTAAQVDQLAEPLVKDHGLLLVEVPRREELTKLMEAATDSLAALGAVERKPELLLLPASPWSELRDAVATALGAEKTTLVGRMFEDFEQRLNDEWVQRTKVLNWELEDQAGGAMVWALLEALRNHADAGGLLANKPQDAELQKLREANEEDFHQRTFLWRKLKSDLVEEMDSELQMPGWGNIWTQPIINRVDMLATGVRTMIGVKVFGPRQEDLTEETIENGIKKVVVKEPGIHGISNQVAGVLRGIRGAVDVFPDQIVGRSYLQIDIDREKAARYGVNVSDIQDTIEVAMGGKTITVTVEGRRRFPVRVRYARDFWQTEEALRRIMVTGRRGTAPPSTPNASALAPAGGMGAGEVFQIPITEVADIKV
ncbi:MAG: efflux RND transporter permease subunit, partial [Planctomycetota bacterium]